MTRAVLFDLDETLIDRRATIERYARALHAEHRGVIERDEDTFIADWFHLDANGTLSRREFFEEVGAWVGIDRKDLTKHYYGNCFNAPILMDGVLDGIEQLRAAGYGLGIITNGGTAGQSLKLDNSGLRALVDASFISEEFGARKPDASIFHAACAAVAVEPSNAWMVGDNPIADVGGGSAVGMRTAWIERHIEWPSGTPFNGTYSTAETGDAIRHILAAG